MPGGLPSWPRVSCPSTTWLCSPPASQGSGSSSSAADLHDLPHAQARRLAGQLRSSAEYAVIEGLHREPGRTACALAEYCGAALLAIEIGVTKRRDIEDSIRRLNRLGTSVVGLAVLPRLRLPARAVRTPAKLSGGSVRLRKAEPVAPAKDGGG